MRTFTLTFNEKGEIVGGNSLSLGNIRQYSSNTYFLRVVIPSSLSATLSVNIERPDGDVATYAIPFNGTDYIIPIPGWVTDFAGEIKITLRGTATSGQATLIYVYGLATLYCEYAVKPTDYTPSDTPGEYDYLLTLINAKAEKTRTINGYNLMSNIVLKLSDFVDDVGYVLDTELTTALLGYVPTSRTVNGKALTGNITLKNSDLENDSGYLTSANLDDYALETDIPTKVSELTNDSNYQTATNLAGVFKGSSFTYDPANGNLSLSFTKFDNTNTTPTVINLPTELIVTSGSYDDETKELVLVLANSTEEVPSEIRIPIDELYNTYFGDNTSIEGFVDTLDGNKDKFRIKAQWIADNITTPLGEKLAKTGDGKDVTITFSVPTEYVAPTSGDSLAVIIGKVTKKLGELKAFAFKDTIVKADLPSDTVYDTNYVHTDNNFTNELKTAYDDAVTKAHTHTNKSVLDSIEGVVTTFPATVGSTEGYLPTVGAVRELYNFPDLDWDGDAETVDGFDASVENIASTIPVRDADAIINVSGVDIAGHPITWNNSDGTLDVELSNNVVLQVGQETLYQVRNQSGSTILNGTAVYCTGVTAGSGRMEISPAIGTLDPVTFLGLATQDISNGVNGFVTHFGYTRGLDTRGTEPSSIAVGDENWAVGDKLYVHPTVAGKLTKVEPQAPYVKICVASVIVRHQSTGVLFVRPTTNLDIKKLSDVQIGTLANNDLISYNNTNGRWENKTFDQLDIPTKTYVDNVVSTGVSNFIDGGSPDTIYLEIDSLDGGSPDSIYE